MAQKFPKTAPTRVRVVGIGRNRVTKGGRGTTERIQVSFESNYPEVNLFSQVIFRTVDDGERRMIGLHVDPLPAPLEVLNAFTFSGKGPTHYLFLLIMAGVAGIYLIAIVFWVRGRKSIRYHWLWLPAILLGTGRVGLNWTTGAVGYRALRMYLIGVGCERYGLDGPWNLEFSIPAAAIAFVVMRKRAIDGSHLNPTNPSSD
jgi:hypothetical protein